MSFDPLYSAVSWLLLRWHQTFTFLGLTAQSGVTWSLSIGCLVITVRALLFLVQRELTAPRRPAHPAGGVLALVVQFPVFIGLFHVLRRLPDGAAQAVLLHAPLAVSLHTGAAQILMLGGHVLATRLVIGSLVALSAAASALTQRLASTAGTTGPMAVVAPISVLVSGVIFPLGLVLYGLVSNLWTLGQQRFLLPPRTQEGGS